MCCGCRERRPQNELIRIGYNDETSTWRINEPANGRSAYWCGSQRCKEQILKQGRLRHALRAPLDEEAMSNLRRRLEDFQR